MIQNFLRYVSLVLMYVDAYGRGICWGATIVLIFLRLFGPINWSWFWVLSPAIFNMIVILLAVGVIALRKQ